MNQKLAKFIATYCGLGLSKFAPGTIGSLGTLPLAYALIYYGGAIALIVVCPILFIIGAIATRSVIETSGNEDPSMVVIDETVGQLLTFAPIAIIAPDFMLGTGSLLYYLCGFVFFRFLTFDDHIDTKK